MLSLATAAELPQVALPEALAICLLLLEKDPARFELAALRWHARLCREARLSLPEATVALAGLSALTSGKLEAGAHALLAVCESRGLEETAATLEDWTEGLSARSRRR
jgi:hypothetical protein